MVDAELFFQIDHDGYVDVDCTNECGETARVEPDGDYDCPDESCGGRLVSPLVLEGLI